MSTKYEEYSTDWALRPQPRFEKVVILDDNETDLFITETIVKAISLSRLVEKSDNADQLLNRLQNTARLSDIPELIFLNIGMKNGQGQSFLQQFNSLADFIRSKCKIVILSSSDDKDLKSAAMMNPGVIRYLHKPLDLHHLKDFMYI